MQVSNNNPINNPIDLNDITDLNNVTKTLSEII